MGTIDILQTKWPAAKIYCVQTWIRGKNGEAATMAGWINTIVAARANTFVGHNETVWLEGGDDGATMTSDGVHYSAAGNVEAAVQWKATLGY